jgi:hypothetical protein
MMARRKLAILTSIALVPVWWFDYHQRQWNAMTIGTTVFILLMLATPRSITQKKWFTIATVATVLLLLPVGAAVIGGRYNMIPFALGISIAMGAGIYFASRPKKV